MPINQSSEVGSAWHVAESLTKTARRPLSVAFLLCCMAGIFLLGNLVGSPSPGVRAAELRWTHGWPAFYLTRTGVLDTEGTWEVTGAFPWNDGIICEFRPLAISLNAAVAVLVSLALLIAFSVARQLRYPSGPARGLAVHACLLLSYLVHLWVVYYFLARVWIVMVAVGAGIFLALVVLTGDLRAAQGKKSNCPRFGLATVLLLAYTVGPTVCVVLAIGPGLLNAQASISPLPPQIGSGTLVLGAVLVAVNSGTLLTVPFRRMRWGRNGLAQFHDVCLTAFGVCLIAQTGLALWRPTLILHGYSTGGLKYVLVPIVWLLVCLPYADAAMPGGTQFRYSGSLLRLAVGTILVILSAFMLTRLCLRTPPLRVNLFSDEMGLLGGSCLLWLAQSRHGCKAFGRQSRSFAGPAADAHRGTSWAPQAAVWINRVLTVTSVGTLSACVISTSGGHPAIGLGLLLLWLPLPVAAQCLIGPVCFRAAVVLISLAAAGIATVLPHVLDSGTWGESQMTLAVVAAGAGFAVIINSLADRSAWKESVRGSRYRNHVC